MNSDSRKIEVKKEHLKTIIMEPLEQANMENQRLRNELAWVRGLLEIREAELESIQTSIAWKIALWLRQGLERSAIIRSWFRFIKRKVMEKSNRMNESAPFDCTIDPYSNRVLDTSYRSSKSTHLFSLVLMASKADPDCLSRTIESVNGQVYSNWELWVTHADSRIRSKINDARIRMVPEGDGQDFGSRYNAALECINGGWAGFLREGDLLTPWALQRVAETITRFSEARMIYTDHDCLDPVRCQPIPCHKTAWDPDRILSLNYIGNLLFIHREILRDIEKQGERPDMDALMYDLILRATEKMNEAEIVHIPEVLYRREQSIPETITPDCLNVLREAVKRRSGQWTISSEERTNTVRLSTVLENRPKVSILIPTRDKVKLLKNCIDGLLRRTDYSPIEILIVDNQSREPRTLRYLNQIASMETISVLSYPEAFNYAAINNFAAYNSGGEILLFLNNDISIQDPGWLKEMVIHAIRPEIGCVGAKLYYPDGRIQHAGVILGLGGVAGHSHRYLKDNHGGYYQALSCTRNVLAVTGACLAVRKSIFLEVGGFDEAFKVAYNDVDFCLRVHAAGYRNLFTPWAELIHHEKRSRGDDDTPEKKRLYENERNMMFRKWGHILLNDPYYNPNLTLFSEDCSLAKKPRDCAPRVVLRWGPLDSEAINKNQA